jgi:hypothetical protein
MGDNCSTQDEGPGPSYSQLDYDLGTAPAQLIQPQSPSQEMACTQGPRGAENSPAAWPTLGSPMMQSQPQPQQVMEKGWILLKSGTQIQRVSNRNSDPC